MPLRKERHGRTLHSRQVLHKVVDRRKLAPGRVSQYSLEPAFGLSGKHGDAQLSASVEIDRAPVKHREASRHMKASHNDGYAGVPERPRDIESAGVLVRLNADEANKTEIAVRSQTGEKSRRVHSGVGLVNHRDVNGNVRPEHLPLGAIGRDAVYGSERIGRDHRAPPADHIPVVVVVRRLDQ